MHTAIQLTGFYLGLPSFLLLRLLCEHFADGMFTQIIYTFNGVKEFIYDCLKSPPKPPIGTP